MTTDNWEAVLPPMFTTAGIDTGGPFRVEPLTGGVSSDIVRIRLADGRDFCAKRALPKLKVASDWQAPLERNHYEVAWLRRANRIVPGAAPKVIGEDRARGIALLEYLPPDDYLLWKSELLAGRADPQVPLAVADALGRIHAATLDDPTAAAEFPTDRPDRRAAPRPLSPLHRRPPSRAQRPHPRRARHHRQYEAGAGAWRRQPQEHPRLEARRAPGAARCRMRLVRRSGLRRRLLPQPPGAEIHPPAAARCDPPRPGP